LTNIDLTESDAAPTGK